eukprot:m.12933 g.12933  ORF g.12933 m.12933 type:complete len:598 (+) comp24408_c0_seq1:59-1852(+)
MSMFKRKTTKRQDKLPTEVKIGKEEIPLAQSDFNVSKISEIQSRFQGGCTLLVPGRIFIREGTLLKICRKGPKPRQFFLFNDVLVYGTILSKGHYAQQHVLTLDQMTVSAECHFMPQVYAIDESQIDEHLDTDNAFQINHTNKSFHVFAPNLSDKNNWLSNLKKLIAKCQTGQENVQLITRAVWVPDRKVTECMVCRKAKFSAFNRKHHCRNCGKVACSSCSSHRIDLRAFHGKSPKPGEEQLERVCTECFKMLARKAKEEDLAAPKPITIVDAQPMASQPITQKKPDRPPPPSSSGDLPSANEAQKVSDSGEETSSDSDDSDQLDEAEKDEMKKTRTSSILHGTSWEEKEKAEEKQEKIEEMQEEEKEEKETPRAPPRRKKQQTEEKTEDKDSDLKICVNCDKKLKIGEFGFLENACYCKEHFKEKYQEMQDAEEVTEEKPVPKPRPAPRKNKEEEVPAVENADVDSQNPNKDKKKAGKSRKPNRFKSSKKAEETTEPEKDGNLLLEDVDTPALPGETTEQPKQTAVDDLLSMNETDVVAVSQPLVSLETNPFLLGFSSEPLIPDSSSAADGSESPKGAKSRRKKTKFKSKLKETE